MHNLAFIKGVMEKLAKMSIVGVKTPLEPHQEAAVDKAISSDKGIILNHGTGSGKSLSGIAIANAIGNPTDVIVPASLKDNYIKEIEKHTDENSVPFHIYSLQDIAAHPDKIKTNRNHTLIVDEAHRLRSDDSMGYDVINNLPNNKKVLLTATPIYNEPNDIVNLINIVSKSKSEDLKYNNIRKYFNDPIDKLIKDKYLKQFKPITNSRINRYSRSLLKELKELGANSREAKLKVLDKYYADDLSYPFLKKYKQSNSLMSKLKVIGEHLANEERLKKIKDEVENEKKYYQDILQDKMVKYVDVFQNKEGLKEFPSQSSEIVQVPMYEEQYRKYKEYFRRLPLTLQNKILNNTMKKLPPSMLQNPFLVKTRMISNMYRGQSSKIDKMVDDIKSSNGKVVVYSNFLNNGLYPIGDKLNQLGIPFKYFTGQEKNRKEIVDDYNNGKIKALLISSAGAEGLDLKETRLVQIMEPHWNDEKIKQVIGRAARYKSHANLPKNQRNVKVKYYVSTIPGNSKTQTIESYMRNLSENKSKISDDVMKLYYNQ